MARARQTFADYKAAVDRAVQAHTELRLDDLEDVPLADWFDEGVPPSTAARRAIRNSGG